LFSFLSKFSPSHFSTENKDSVSYIGPFTTWDEAVNASTGYNDPTITKKAVSALNMILSGEKLCEKDTILFDEYQYSLPLILGINYIAKSINGKIVVLDYGGGFASSFFRNIDILRQFDIHWIVIEQEDVVKIAIQKLSSFRELQFISVSDFKEEKETIEYDVLLFGSSLQFLENPELEVSKVINEGVKSIIFEQTPFVISGSRQLTVQQIREPIYDSSYPAWHFDQNEFLAWIGNQYELRYKSHNPHVMNYCNNFASTLKDYVFTGISKVT
jgi:putative methyltransferase (TIGR04325 family)